MIEFISIMKEFGPLYAVAASLMGAGFFLIKRLIDYIENMNIEHRKERREDREEFTKALEKNGDKIAASLERIIVDVNRGRR